jgi:integrase
MARYTVETATGKKPQDGLRQDAREGPLKSTRGWFEGDDQILETYLLGWIRDIEGTIKQRTLENYEYVVRKHIAHELGVLKLEALKPNLVRRLFKEKMDEGLCNRTVQHIHTVLRKAL